ncbi:MAG TPA: signal peptidase I [Patescibacteria group bacterium]|nr:signal peptidase I [Patescibacteria group bacterium]
MLKKILLIVLGILVLPIWVALFFLLGQNGAEFIDNLQKGNQLQSMQSILPRMYIVESGSMEPGVKVGSVVFVVKSENYVSGDVVTFDVSGRGKNVVTHRIAYKKFPDGIGKDPVFITKGDANEDLDSASVRPDQIIGKVQLAVPYVGYLANYAKKPWGFILLVIVPATILIYEELRSLISEIVKKIKNRKGQAHAVDSERGVKKMFTFIPVFGAAIVMLSFSASFFSDTEGSLGNLFRAGEWSPPTRIAQTLVINEVLPDSSCSQGNTEAQWIELYNGYNFAVNPKNYKITDGTNTVDLVTANNLTIQPGEFLLLAHSSAIWNSCYDDNGTQTGNLGGTLNIDVGQLKLIDTNGTTVIDVTRWNVNGDAIPSQNQSIERVPIGIDSVTGDDFEPSDFIVRERPTPGYGSNIILNELLSNPDTTFTTEWVELYNPSLENIDLTNWTLVDAANNIENVSSLGTANSLTYSVYERSEGWLNNTGGETLKLINLSGQIIDQHTFGALTDDKSTGRNTDRNTIWTLPCTGVSKGISNNNVCVP